MKKLLSFILLWFSCNVLGDAINLVSESGLQIVRAKVNGVEFPFVLDTGASTTLLPSHVIATMMLSGTITDADILGKESGILADGSSIETTRINIREFEIGNIILKNVEVATMPSAPNSSLLLGQSVLGRLSSWRIDNRSNSLIIGEDNKGITSSHQVLRSNLAWHQNKNGAIGENGIGINFPYDQTQAKLVICSNDYKIKNKDKVRVMVIFPQISSEVIWSGIVEKNSSGECWFALIIDSLLSTLKNANGSIVIGLADINVINITKENIVMIESSLSGSFDAINHAWRYSLNKN